MVKSKKVEENRRGAPKGHVGNPEGKNQYAGILSEKPVPVRLYSEDYEKLQELAEGKNRGFIGQFVREAVRDAIAKLTENNN